MAKKRTTKRGNGSADKPSQAEACREAWSQLGAAARGPDVVRYVKERYGYGPPSSVISNAKKMVHGRAGRKKKVVTRRKPSRPTADALDLSALKAAHQLMAATGSPEKAIRAIRELQLLQIQRAAGK